MGTSDSPARQENRAVSTPGAALLRLQAEQLRRHRMPPSRAALLAVLLASAANRGWTYQSVERLAQLSQVAERTARYALRDLEARGLIATIQRPERESIYLVHSERAARTRYLEQRATGPHDCQWSRRAYCHSRRRRPQLEAPPCAQQPRQVAQAPQQCLRALEPTSARIPRPAALRAAPGGFPRVERVAPGSPAEGRLQPGDVLLAVEGRSLALDAQGKPPRLPLASDVVTVELWRAGRTLHTTLRPRWSTAKSRFELGLHLQGAPPPHPERNPQQERGKLEGRGAKFAPTVPPERERDSERVSLSLSPATSKDPEPRQGSKEQTPCPSPAETAKKLEGFAEKAEEPEREETEEERENRVFRACAQRWRPVLEREKPEIAAGILRLQLGLCRRREHNSALSPQVRASARVERAWLEREITRLEAEKSVVVEQNVLLERPDDLRGSPQPQPIPEGTGPEVQRRLLHRPRRQVDLPGGRAERLDGVDDRPELRPAGSARGGPHRELLDGPGVAHVELCAGLDEVRPRRLPNIDAGAHAVGRARGIDDPLQRHEHGRGTERSDAVMARRQHDFARVEAAVEHVSRRVDFDALAPSEQTPGAPAGELDVGDGGERMQAPDAGREPLAVARTLAGTHTPQPQQTVIFHRRKPPH